MQHELSKQWFGSERKKAKVAEEAAERQVRLSEEDLRGPPGLEKGIGSI